MMELRPQEIVIVIGRKHWFIFAIETMGFAFASFLPLFVVLFQPIIGKYFLSYALFGASLYWMALLLALYIEVLRLWLDALIVTNKRIIIIEQHGLFHREVTEFEVDKVQDVTVETEGLAASLLSFGTMTIQTAGERFFTVSRMGEVDHVKKCMLEIARQKHTV